MKRCYVGMVLAAIALGWNSPAIAQPDPAPTEVPASPTPDIDRWQQQAAAITVRVFSGPNSGSGTILSREGQTYTVLTNHHVLVFGDGDTYPLRTPDGRTHTARTLPSPDLEGYDLALLQFTSDRPYTTATLGDSNAIAVGEEVLAAGFPAEPTESGPEFVTTTGTISLFSDPPFGGGYELGYTNDIHKGMSGGPVLNRRGEVVAINGIHAYPVWGNPYIFPDGSWAEGELRDRMSQLSWAIPIATVTQLHSPFASGPAPPPSEAPRYRKLPARLHRIW